MFELMREQGLDRRHGRLVSLLYKLRDAAYTQTGKGEGALQQSALSVIEKTSQTIDKVMSQLVYRQCDM